MRLTPQQRKELDAAVLLRLKISGESSAHSIASDLDDYTNLVRMSLNRLVRQGKVIKREAPELKLAQHRSIVYRIA